MDVSGAKKDSTKSNVEEKYIIYGNPIPLQRPRMSYGHVWDAQKKLKHSWAMQLEEQSPEFFAKAVPLRLDVSFFMQIPRMSAPKRKAYENKWHATRADLDNLIKWVLDASMGVLFTDDCIVASIAATKQYSENPRTEFTLKKLTNIDLRKIELESQRELADHVLKCRGRELCGVEGCPNYKRCECCIG